MGLAAAHAIRKDSNFDVLVLDRYGIGNDYCSSNDVNRVFRYSYGSDELYTEMAVESFSLWRELEKDSRRQLLIQTGLLLLQGEDKNSNGFNEASHTALLRMRLGAEKLDKEELTRRFPQFRAEEAFFDPHGGILLASEALQTLYSSTRAQGVTFREGRARKIVTGERKHITTDSHGEIEFRKLIVTVGPWTNGLRTEGMVPVNPTRQQLIYFSPRGGIEQFRPGRCPVFFTDNHYGLPAAGVDAVKVSPKELTETVDPDMANRSVDDEQISGCREACRKFVPGIADGEIAKTKVCIYDMTENSDFVLDKDPENYDIVYGYGFSGHGFKFAPFIGQLLAELALDKRPSFDLERFSALMSRRRQSTLGAQLGKGK